jgi:hypothetical protein
MIAALLSCALTIWLFGGYADPTDQPQDGSEN